MIFGTLIPLIVWPTLIIANYLGSIFFNWNPDSEDVDAFCYDWEGDDNWLGPAPGVPCSPGY